MGTAGTCVEGGCVGVWAGVCPVSVSVSVTVLRLALVTCLPFFSCVCVMPAHPTEARTGTCGRDDVHTHHQLHTRTYARFTHPPAVLCQLVEDCKEQKRRCLEVRVCVSVCRSHTHAHTPHAPHAHTNTHTLYCLWCRRWRVWNKGPVTCV